MESMHSNNVAGWFKAAAIVALLWNLIGVLSYLVHVQIVAPPGAAAAEDPFNTPVWVTAAYAIAVFAGALGSLGLVMRKRWAKPLLLASLAALVVQNLWVLLLSGAPQALGMLGVIMPLMAVVVGALLVWMANTADRKGWLA